MKSAALDELSAKLGCEVRLNEPLSEYTTYRIGGPASAMVFPRSAEDVAAAVRFARETETPYLILGLGSNVLIADRGFDGIVIRIGKGMDRLERVGEGTVWRAGAGLPTPILARRTAAAGQAGVHLLVGVPGTVGGGVFMNAGAHGQEFGRVVREVKLVDSAGEYRTLKGEEIAWRYRASGLDSNVVVEAIVELEASDPGELKEEVARHLRWRKAGTPFTQPCCGSVFRNPSPPGTSRGAPGKTAGQLIDAAGMKGFTVGKAQVSPKHANYIVNLGGATAAEVLAVIEAVRERVLKEFGIELELEVKVIA
ncbi:MAG: UDP-N-acetylenolpyruvoylglucosamine reductase 1 [Gemmatimonadales bacterium]|nr:MAG: UDP-N-acetylenolpyruvoylglucosamine reductase 1 [Gemmatimonadales bacterium]